MKQGSILRVLLALWLLPIAMLLLLAVNPKANAAINSQINFQGKLTNPDGTNVTNGTYSIVFSIYSVSSGGTAVWSETQNSVTITDGNFQVALGSVNTALASSVDFNSAPLYLGIKVGSDAEMTPRVTFTATPYAFNSDKLGGISSAGFVQLSPGTQQTGNINVSGTVNGNTLNNSSFIFGGTSAASIQSAASQALNVDSGTSGTVALGATNATTITIGKRTTQVNLPGSLDIDSGATAPTADQLIIDNTASGGVTTAGVNAVNVRYKGGAANVEAAGMRIDYTPGTTSGGVWSGLRINAGSTGPVSGVTAYGIKLEGPTAQGAGQETAVNVASGWDIGIDVQSGGLQLAAQNEPATPTGSNLRIYAKDIAGRIMPKWIGPAGIDTPVQASLGFNRVAQAVPNGVANCSTGFNPIGTSFATVGTCTVGAMSSANLLGSIRRIVYPTGATAGTIVSQRQGSLMATRGSAAGVGGFFFTTRFATSSLATTNYSFVGLSDSLTVPGATTNPTTATTPGKVGMALTSSTATWKIVSNVSGTAPVVIDLGANFTASTTNLYELVLFSAPNGSTIGWRATNLTTGSQQGGSIATGTPTGATLPANTAFLAPLMYMSNNGTGANAALDNAGWYLESDN